jgi:hypothetical protein
MTQRRPLLALNQYLLAFTLDLSIRKQSGSPYLFRAACAAYLVGTGKHPRTEITTAEQRAECRINALAWFAEDLKQLSDTSQNLWFAGEVSSLEVLRDDKQLQEEAIAWMKVAPALVYPAPLSERMFPPVWLPCLGEENDWSWPSEPVPITERQAVAECQSRFSLSLYFYGIRGRLPFQSVRVKERRVFMKVGFPQL